MENIILRFIFIKIHFHSNIYFIKKIIWKGGAWATIYRSLLLKMSVKWHKRFI